MQPRRALLVSIFLVQFFAFYEDQLGAIAGVAFDLVFLAVVSYGLNAERARRATTMASAVRAGEPRPEVPLPASSRAL